MKRVFVFLIVSAVLSLLPASIAPESVSIGTVAVDIREGSAEELVYKALKGEYSDEWLEKYTLSPISFALAYSEELSLLLPMDNFLISTMKNNEIKVLDQMGGSIITFIIKDGKIEALRVEE